MRKCCECVGKNFVSIVYWDDNAGFKRVRLSRYAEQTTLFLEYADSHSLLPWVKEDNSYLPKQGVYRVFSAPGDW